MGEGQGSARGESGFSCTLRTRTSGTAACPETLLQARTETAREERRCPCVMTCIYAVSGEHIH